MARVARKNGATAVSLDAGAITPTFSGCRRHPGAVIGRGLECQGVAEDGATRAEAAGQHGVRIAAGLR